MILDTNALSAAADGESEVVAILECAAEVAIPVVVIGEYRYGIQHSRHRKRYESWLKDILLGWRILALDLKTADEYAAVRTHLRVTGKPIPANDAWIAALARQHHLPVLSRDRHFDAIPGLARLPF